MYMYMCNMFAYMYTCSHTVLYSSRLMIATHLLTTKNTKKLQ